MYPNPTGAVTVVDGQPHIQPTGDRGRYWGFALGRGRLGTPAKRLAYVAGSYRADGFADDTAAVGPLTYGDLAEIHADLEARADEIRRLREIARPYVRPEQIGREVAA